MQCGELMYRKVTIMTHGSDSVDNRQKKPEKETIHSGHFMVSTFEAEAQDDEYNVAVPLPDEDEKLSISPSIDETTETFVSHNQVEKTTQVSIETSLTKLFQCMSLAYRQKLTSPKWNRFKGIRLRWKDKIRLNNVIWRCWHMQFIMKQNTMVCQFASPLDVDTHSKPEAVVLEGKYWKRKLAAVTAEYKKWRMFYRNRIMGWASKDSPDMLQRDMDMFDWQPNSNDSNSMSMMVDEDYMEFMSDTLFSTIQSNQPFAFPDSREIARGASLADFIQPSLVQLQPNLDDFMDTLEPLHDLMTLSQSMKLPSVPEESVVDDIYNRTSAKQNALTMNSSFSEISLLDSQVPLTQPQQQQQKQQRQIQQQFSQQQRQQQQQPQAIAQPQQLSPQQLTQQHRQSPQQELQQTQQSLQQYTATIFTQPEVSTAFAAPENLISRTENFAQGSAGLTFEESATVVPVSSAATSHRRSARSPDGRVQRQQQQQLQQQQQAAAVAATLYVPQRNQQQPVVQSQSSSFQSVPVSLTTQPSVQSQAQAQPFLGQQTVFRPRPQQPSLPQAQGFKSPSLTAVADLSLNAACVSSVSPPLRLNILRSNSLTGSEGDLFAVPKLVSGQQQMQGKLRTRSRSGPLLVPSTSSQQQQQPLQTRQHPPPLMPSNSDPSLPTVSSASLQPLLAHLLSSNNSNSGVFNFTGSDRFKPPILPMPPQGVSASAQSSVSPTTTLLITTPVSMATVSSLGAGSGQSPQASSSAAGSQLVLKGGPYSPDSSTSIGLCSLSPQLNMQTMSPPKPLRVRPDSASQPRVRRPDSTPPKEHRRECHTKAEHKRRCNIKNGFDMLHSLIPQLHQNPNAKLSKAAMLQKGAEYIQQLRTERDQLREEMQCLKQEIECLNASISNCQSLLPATGAPVSRQRTGKMREMFDDYVRIRTLENWKFWIFSILIEPLLTSYNTSVSTASLEDMYRSTLHWVEQHCSLVDLRPAFLNSLRYLSTATEILTDPSKLPEEARRAVLKQDRQH